MEKLFLDSLKSMINLGQTENGAVKRFTTYSGLLDLFALGGAYRTRSDVEVISLFERAFLEDETYAMKCLFYLRDVRGGQGERRFWRVCMKWLAQEHTEAARRNLKYVAEFGRYDDYLVLLDTPLKDDVLEILGTRFAMDLLSPEPSLLAKWLPSENASSKETKRQAAIIRHAFGLSAREYRKALSFLRNKINVLEKLMSAREWEKIDFSKIPSKAGFQYKEAFLRHDEDRIAKGCDITYKSFIEDSKTKVNAQVLYPYECVAAVWQAHDDFSRATVNKYWDNLKDYFNGAIFNGLAVVDTSGSMTWGSNAKCRPIDVSISLGIYCAERAKGPFANHYITFSRNPQLIEIKENDFCSKVRAVSRRVINENTNIAAVFDLLLNTAIQSKCAQEDLPENIIIISDMEFDSCLGYQRDNFSTLIENIEKTWNEKGYKMPKLIFWNVNARTDNIPMNVKNGVTLVSGISPSIFKQILTGKTSFDLMFEVLDSKRYSNIK